jgi:rRNA maturation endonuclease Nob1
MVHCRACGKEIHESARVCPQCGAPQATATEGSDKITEWV